MNAYSLHPSAPPKSDCIFIGRLAHANEQAVYTGSFNRYRVRLTADMLWCSEELYIPLANIESTQIIRKGWLIRRHALEIVYRDPVSRFRSALYLCHISPLGTYQKKRLEKLEQLITQQRQQIIAVPGRDPSHEIIMPHVCEVCGSRDAYLVHYVYMIGAVAFWYRAQRQRVHCPKHMLVEGLCAYAITALTGWLGLSVIVWPITLIQNARTLRPAMGRIAYALPIPPLAGAVFLLGLLFKWWSL